MAKLGRKDLQYSKPGQKDLQYSKAGQKRFTVRQVWTENTYSVVRLVRRDLQCSDLRQDRNLQCGKAGQKKYL